MAVCSTCHGTNWRYAPPDGEGWPGGEVPCGCEELLEELAEQSYRIMQAPTGPLEGLFAAREALTPLVEEIKRLRAKVAEMEQNGA